jgi:hypothetical protein
LNTRFYQPGWSSDGANEVVVWKCLSLDCTSLKRNKLSNLTLEKNKKYSYHLNLTNGTLNFYINNINVIDIYDESLLNLTGVVGFWNWGGDYGLGAINKYDNFSINSASSLSVFPTTTPTPTLITTSTPIPTLTPSPTPSPTLIPTVIPTPTLIPTAVPTSIPTPTPTSSIRKKENYHFL